ncbi:hypothetical protein Tco_0873904 [Tanacetum coccineum]|uniref:Reverse transcriptase domain-containing protein n=1 Tax=Tanacetum coccineum TaxID=301880 RepID=A0ABQ5BNS0_9ASTR
MMNLLRLNSRTATHPLPPLHLEYAFLEGDNKLPVIIAKELDVEEKSALIKVLKSHKRALAWKLSDIQGNNRNFVPKILMEETMHQRSKHQRRVNPKIHDAVSTMYVSNLSMTWLRSDWKSLWKTLGLWEFFQNALPFRPHASNGVKTPT